MIFSAFRWLRENWDWAIIVLMFGASLVLLALPGLVHMLRRRKEALRVAATPQPTKVAEITYEFNPATPEVPPTVWDFNYKDPGVRVNFVVPPDPPVAGCIGMIPTGRCSIRMPLQQSLTLCDRLKFIAHFVEDSAVYVWVELAREGVAKAEVKIIGLTVGNGPPVPCGNGTSEWNLPVPGKPVQGLWREFEVSLPDAVKNTFGPAGWHYRRLMMLSIRGYIYISPISLYESQA